MKRFSWGGAASIVDLFDAARLRAEQERAAVKSRYEKELAENKQPKEPKYRFLPEEPYAVRLGISTPPITGSACGQEAFAVWKPFPKGGKLVWRANLLMGYGNRTGAPNDETQVQAAPPSPECRLGHRPEPLAEMPRPTLLILDDAGFQLRHREHRNCWLLPDNQRLAPQWILLKMSSPAAQGDLFAEFNDRFADRVVCLTSVQELRRECVGVSCGLSWERTVEDVLQALETNPVLSRLRRFRHVVITFGVDGALWLDYSAGSAPQCRLVFDAGGKWQYLQSAFFPLPT